VFKPQSRHLGPLPARRTLGISVRLTLHCCYPALYSAVNTSPASLRYAARGPTVDPVSKFHSGPPKGTGELVSACAITSATVLRAPAKDEAEVNGEGQGTEEALSPKESEDRESSLFFVFQADRPLALPARISLRDAQKVTVGRGPAFSVRRDSSTRSIRVEIPDIWMSSAHLQLTQVLGRWLVEDLKSRNGTFLNHQPLERFVLSDGDVLEAGHVFFIYRRLLPAGVDAGRVAHGNASAELAGFGTLLPTLERELSDLAKVAPSLLPVIIQGESGTGKELIARGLHELSRRTGPFVAINCAAIPVSLVESELFGHRKGAFTGAADHHLGLIRAADRGTLFLDEIGDLPIQAQASLLRVLQERQVQPLGELRPVSVDVRFCAASHQPLEPAVAQHLFRADLLARLTGLTVHLPPLRERREDLGLLLSAILSKLETDRDIRELVFQRRAARALFKYSWPANIRELQKSMEAALMLASKGAIGLEHLPPSLRQATEEEPKGTKSPRPEADSDPALKEELIRRLTENRGNVAAVSRAFSRKPTQIRRWIRRFGLDLQKYRP